jgi:hypothetical protein
MGETQDAEESSKKDGGSESAAIAPHAEKVKDKHPDVSREK